MIKELIFNVEKQEDGTYLASCEHNNGIMLAESLDYRSLQKEVAKTVKDYIFHGYGKKFGWPENPKIRLIYSELFSNNHDSENILITGNPEGQGYRAVSNSNLNLNMYNEDFDVLRENLIEELQKRECKKNVEFRLEEVLD
ncbi:MAG: hypothetical protein KJ767_02950 [Nanoarchaeota archaeon]|nr:hypothetical protein [Nanoarchaeota archaeon]